MSLLKTIQLFLFPLSLAYEGVLRFRNYLYDSEFFGSTEFDLPIISVGNLAFGGTGKTPHTEYLIRLLQTEFHPAVLSRGYGRKTSGYQVGNAQATPWTLGDEPFQMLKKFPGVPVAAAENRVLGIPNLLMDAPDTDVILLDDAFQHRAVKAGLNILLTEYHRLYSDDALFPSGYLREYKSASHRADVIVVTKCPPNLSVDQRQTVIQKLKSDQRQQVFFSWLEYGEPVPYFQTHSFGKPRQLIGLAGIANPELFINHLKSISPLVEFRRFPDHHNFKRSEIEHLLNGFDTVETPEKAIVTTEKDFQKLALSPFSDLLKEYPFFYIPIEVTFEASEKERFNQMIHEYVRTGSRNG